MSALANTALPALSSALSDELLAEHIRRNNQVIFNTKDKASKLYDLSLKFNAPHRYKAFMWKGFQQRIANARARGLGVEELRAALEALVYISEFILRFNCQLGLQELRERFAAEEAKAQQIDQPFVQMFTPAPPPPFDASALISGMVKAGIQLGLKDGAITAIPASSLSEQNRELIKAHKAAIVEVLSNAETVA
ncbi:MAG TPA: hypothetical protein VIE65_03780 [Methylobacter sp.]|jgi:hypothetical protein